MPMPYVTYVHTCTQLRKRTAPQLPHQPVYGGRSNLRTTRSIHLRKRPWQGCLRFCLRLQGSPPSLCKKKSEKKEKFSEWPPLCAASGVGDVCVFFVVVLVLFFFCCCTRLHRYTRFTHAEVMRVQRVLVYLYMLKGEYWYS